MSEEQDYLTGFGNEFATEAIRGALPVGMNNPQQAPHGLYAEQLSGTAFTALNHENQRSWLYRILPSVRHTDFLSTSLPFFRTAPDPESEVTPNQLRWDAFPYPDQPEDFIESIRTILVNGNCQSQSGCGVHVYTANKSMDHQCFVNSDGEMLIVPQEGGLTIRTEFGTLQVAPKDIAVIPRGVKFQVNLMNGKARGYICENYGTNFQLPYRGPIGANGLANARDFEYPRAAFEDRRESFRLINKFCGNFFSADLPSSPFDVVGWHGNYAPYRYNLDRFNTINTVSFDHPDPSIFTVLTSPSGRAGVANIDFVIFPPRWMVAEQTFRPPWFHRNIMSEYMGLIEGIYDAKPAGGFDPGGGSLHNCMSAHGPEADAFAKASTEDLQPTKQEGTLAFMFESCLAFQPTAFAKNCKQLQKDYLSCWQGLKPQFKN